LLLRGRRFPSITKAMPVAFCRLTKGSDMAQEAKAKGRNTDALQKPLTPSDTLAAIVGAAPLPRGQVVAKVWDYIRKHNLQKPTDKRVIIADAKLKPIFGKDECTMFEMNKYLAAHLK
jgi:chromatin remodeling complex protein RSC6